MARVTIEYPIPEELTGEDIQGMLLALADPIRKLISSEPQSGQKKIYGFHVNASGNLESTQDDVPEV